MFTGLFEYNKWMAVFACISIILSATYMLNMVQKVFFGNTNSITENVGSLSGGQKITLSVIVAAIIILGIYPGPVLHLTQDTVTDILQKFK